jgi:hypothetical protein
MSEISNLKSENINNFIDCRYFLVENEAQGWLLMVKKYVRGGSDLILLPRIQHTVFKWSILLRTHSIKIIWPRSQIQYTTI